MLKDIKKQTGQKINDLQISIKASLPKSIVCSQYFDILTKYEARLFINYVTLILIILAFDFVTLVPTKAIKMSSQINLPHPP